MAGSGPRQTIPLRSISDAELTNLASGRSVGLDEGEPATRCSPWTAFFEVLVDRVVLPEDAPATVQRKRMLVHCLACFLALLIITLPFVSQMSIDQSGLKILSWVTATVTAIISVARLAISRSAPDAAVLFLVYATAFSVMIADVGFAADFDTRPWPLFVLLVDIMIVMRIPTFHAAFFVGCCCTWLILLQYEIGFRFGMLDLPGTMDYDDRRSNCACDRPPCMNGNVPKTTATALTITFIFVFSVYCTRRFSAQLIREKEQMLASVAAADVIADMLADFDLEDAKAHLDAHCGSIEPGLHQAFSTLLRNLRSYRPFLPPVLFAVCHRDAERASAVAAAPQALEPETPASGHHPRERKEYIQRKEDQHGVEVKRQLSSRPPGFGSERPHVTIVLVGIDSTALWSTAWDAMPDATALYRQVTRKLTTQLDGYEAKAVGDDFMMAFNSTAAALQFALELHRELLKAPWADALLAAPGCRRDLLQLWGGLAVKVGLDLGQTNLRLDELSGRWVYHGPVVSRASKLMVSCPSGATLASDAVAEVLHEEATLAGDIFSIPVQGVGCLFLPLELSGRSELMTTELSSLHSDWQTNQISIQSPLETLAFPPALDVDSTTDSFSRGMCSIESVSTVDVASPQLVERSQSRSVASELSRPPSARSGAMGTGATASIELDLLGPPPRLAPPDPLAGRRLKIQNYLERVSAATIGCVMLRSCPDLDACPDRASHMFNKTFACILAQAERTSGTLLALSAGTFTIGWNVHGVCEAHIESSFRFVGWLYRKAEPRGTSQLGTPESSLMSGRSTPRRLPPQLPLRAVTGLSNGSVLFGRVGLSRQTFVTAIGFPSYLAPVLAAGAARLQTDVLYASEDGHPSPATVIALRRYTRPVDSWYVGGHTKKVGVLEVDAIGIGASSGEASQDMILAPNDFVGNKPVPTWAWSEQYRAAFKKKDVPKLDAASATDRVVNRVCDMLVSRSHIFGSQDIPI